MKVVSANQRPIALFNQCQNTKDPPISTHMYQSNHVTEYKLHISLYKIVKHKITHDHSNDLFVLPVTCNFLSPVVLKQNLWAQVAHVFTGWIPHTNNSVKALKETQSINFNEGKSSTKCKTKRTLFEKSVQCKSLNSLLVSEFFTRLYPAVTA